MVADTSRWSRDNLKSFQDLVALKQNGIRFFVGMQEFNLNDHFHELVLTLGVAINQFFAREQAYKSIINRIERAKKGYPACGKRPWGRIFDGETHTWKVDEAKNKMIEEISRLYLEEDVPFNELGKIYRMNGTNPHKILTKRSGDTWTQRFRNKNCGIDETVTIHIPRLLPEETIRKIRAKCEARRTWEHGKYKYEYLFSRNIRDADTGNALTGTGNSLGRRYYKPFKATKTTPRYMVNANTLESAILRELFMALGNSSLLFDAVFKGNPVSAVADDLTEKKSRLEKKLAVLERERQRYIDAIGAGDDDVPSFMAKLKTKIKALEEEIGKATFDKQSVENQLSTIPVMEEVEMKRKWYGEQLRKKFKEMHCRQLDQRWNEGLFTSGYAFSRLPFEQKKKLINLIFGGHDEGGKRYGIYVKLLHGRPRRYKFEAYGRLGTIDGWVRSRQGDNAIPEEPEYDFDSYIDKRIDKAIGRKIAKVLVEADPELVAAHHSVSGGEFDESKTTYASKRHAYHSLGLHQ